MFSHVFFHFCQKKYLFFPVTWKTTLMQRSPLTTRGGKLCSSHVTGRLTDLRETREAHRLFDSEHKVRSTWKEISNNIWTLRSYSLPLSLLCKCSAMMGVLRAESRYQEGWQEMGGTERRQKLLLYQTQISGAASDLPLVCWWYAEWPRLFTWAYQKEDT